MALADVLNSVSSRETNPEIKAHNEYTAQQRAKTTNKNPINRVFNFLKRVYKGNLAAAARRLGAGQIGGIRGITYGERNEGLQELTDRDLAREAADRANVQARSNIAGLARFVGNRAQGGLKGKIPGPPGLPKR